MGSTRQQTALDAPGESFFARIQMTASRVIDMKEFCPHVALDVRTYTERRPD